MKIKFIEGTEKNDSGERYIIYEVNGKYRTCLGCYIYPYTKGLTVLFKKTCGEERGNTILVVKQKKLKKTVLILIHELLHWIISKFTQVRYFHNLIDKYL